MSNEENNLDQSSESEVGLDENDRADLARLVSGHDPALNNLIDSAHQKETTWTNEKGASG